MNKRSYIARFICAPGYPTVTVLEGGCVMFNCYYACRAQGGLGQGCLLEYLQEV